MHSRYKRIILVLVALLGVLFFVINRSFYEDYLVPRPIWKLNEDAPYYLVDQNWIDEYAKSFGVEQIKALKFDTSVKEVVTQMQNSKENFYRELQLAVRGKFTEIFKKELRKEVAEEVRNGVCLESDYSYESLEVVRSQYLLQNGEKIKNGILKELFKDNEDDEFKAVVNRLDSFQIDKGSYFRLLITDVILKNGPESEGGIDSGLSFYGSAANSDSPRFSKEHLLEGRVKLSDPVFHELKRTHTSLVEAVRRLGVPHMDLFHGSGILLACGPEHINGAMNIIVQLRELGSKLPVELILDRNVDYNAQVCEELMPKLNGKCLIMEELLGTDFYESLKIQEFQSKVLAQLVSSFDHTIFLDSDSFPIVNVDEIFDTEQYLSTKFIIWRDMWKKTTSPLYYDIAGFRPGEVVRGYGLEENVPFSEYCQKNKDTEVEFHDLDGLPPVATVESGQMVYSKREHFRVFVLAFYYNFYGPSYYYDLLYQGAFGTGDKDTYEPGLHILKEPYYLTEFPVTFGGVKVPNENGEGTYIAETTLIQRDFVKSFEHYRQWQEWLAENGHDTRLNLFQRLDFIDPLREAFTKSQEEKGRPKEPPAMFLHVHSPKINALANEVSTKLKYDYESRYLRDIGDFDDIMGSTDWELKFQSINAWVTCEGITDHNYWGRHELDQAAVCEKARGYVAKLKESSNDLGAAHLKTCGGWSG